MILLQPIPGGNDSIPENVPDETTTGIVENTETIQESMNVWSIIMDGGVASIIIMIILGILSFIAVFMFIERLITISKAGREDSNFMNNIKDFISGGKFDAAISLCKATNSPIARMIEKGVGRIGRPLNDISASIENVAKLEIYRMERGVALLATISGAAPMIGFLGTVFGMIKAFFSMQTSFNLTGAIQLGELAGGMYGAMTTTAAGLFVGIIAFMGYNILVSSIEKVVYKMETRSVEFLDLLNAPSN